MKTREDFLTKRIYEPVKIKGDEKWLKEIAERGYAEQAKNIELMRIDEKDLTKIINI